MHSVQPLPATTRGALEMTYRMLRTMTVTPLCQLGVPMWQHSVLTFSFRLTVIFSGEIHFRTCESRKTARLHAQCDVPHLERISILDSAEAPVAIHYDRHMTWCPC